MPSVKVYEGNFEKALRKFKKQVTNARVLDEVRERAYYEKPSAKRQRKKAAAKARTRRDTQADPRSKRLY